MPHLSVSLLAWLISNLFSLLLCLFFFSHCHASFSLFVVILPPRFSLSLLSYFFFFYLLPTQYFFLVSFYDLPVFSFIRFSSNFPRFLFFFPFSTFLLLTLQFQLSVFFFLFKLSFSLLFYSTCTLFFSVSQWSLSFLPSSFPFFLPCSSSSSGWFSFILSSVFS